MMRPLQKPSFMAGTEKFYHTDGFLGPLKFYIKFSLPGFWSKALGFHNLYLSQRCPQIFAGNTIPYLAQKMITSGLFSDIH
jgi:hypothetical protein